MDHSDSRLITEGEREEGLGRLYGELGGSRWLWDGMAWAGADSENILSVNNKIVDRVNVIAF